MEQENKIGLNLGLIFSTLFYIFGFLVIRFNLGYEVERACMVRLEQDCL